MKVVEWVRRRLGWKYKGPHIVRGGDGEPLEITCLYYAYFEEEQRVGVLALPESVVRRLRLDGTFIVSSYGSSENKDYLRVHVPQNPGEESNLGYR